MFKTLLNGVLLLLVAAGYGLWFGLRVVFLPLEWLLKKMFFRKKP